MKINNSIGKTFGGPPVAAAYLFLLTGISIIPMQKTEPLAVALGVLMIFAACFVIFTTSGVEIEPKNHRIKQYNKIFGFIKAGKWRSMDLYIGVTLIHMKKVYRVASRANLTNSSTENDYRIFLVDKKRRPAFVIKKCKNLNEAHDSLDEFSIWLKCPVYSPRKKRS